MRRRRSRRNIWWGAPRRHSKAARKGWGRRRSRRTRRNAGSLVRTATRSLGAGFKVKAWEQATAILAGNVGATFFTDKATQALPVLRNPFLQIGTLLLTAGGQMLAVKKLAPKYAANVLVGGILAGVTRAAKMVLPGRFITCGLGEDFEGLDDWFMNPRLAQSAFPLHGMDGYASPQARMIGTSGMGDEATLMQAQHAITLDGFADMALAEELAQQM